MPTSPRSPSLTDRLRAAAADYQSTSVIPHCPTCQRPCCKLDPLVLELNWKQLKSLWQIEEARKAFDQRLAEGRGPQEIRAADGLYFVHGKTCPAYDTVGGGCRVYNQPVKPVGCTDFPVYEDGDVLIADLRCEAVDLDALGMHLADKIGAGFRIVREADPDFPFLVTLSAKKRRPGRK